MGGLTGKEKKGAVKGERQKGSGYPFYSSSLFFFSILKNGAPSSARSTRWVDLAGSGLITLSFFLVRLIDRSIDRSYFFNPFILILG